ncbi:gliding motility-associated C-terminal domain-containing protein [Tangfeifania diversioriginum]|uniref:Gliding motility-associated C-terminal domain-containing protein n=2 Tax=Tangfeifania diversioriginum TaxID=1168035 RepID=A0A1M6MDN6_9BACT|nr:gliding motility-associated C-terminal domain-containing protein [Tangfeifania diversioriginum]
MYGSFAQENSCIKSTEGTDFWFGFMESRHYQEDHYLEVTVTARETTTFQITYGRDEIPINGNYQVQANSSMQVEIPWDKLEVIGSENTENKGIHLTSEKPVNVYALNWSLNSADVAAIYPVPSLGKEYFAMCYYPSIDLSDPEEGNGRNSEFLVVAAFDSTAVNITPSKVTDQLKPRDSTFSVILNKGEVYQLQSENEAGTSQSGQGDLTGSYIEADKPVAFYSGSLSTQVPSGKCCWEHLYEQIPPVHSWGLEYYAVPLKSREQDRYRILAAQNNTTVQISGRSPFTLNRGEFEEAVFFNSDPPKRILADKPVLVAQYSQSRDVDSTFTGGYGDPFMIILSPVNQSLKKANFVAYNSPDLEFEDFVYEGIKNYFVNILTPTNQTENIRVNNQSVQNEFREFPKGNYSYAQIEISNGSHQIESTGGEDGFLAYVYGFGGIESYGYSAGSNLNLTLDIGESPWFESDTIMLCYGETRTLDAGPWFDSYTWNTGETTQKISISEAGKYSVRTTTTEGCVLEDSVMVLVNRPVTIDLGEDDTGCQPYSIELEGTESFERYIWQNESGDTLSTSQKIMANETGEYQVTVFDEFNCPGYDTMQLVVFPVPEVEFSGPELVCGEKSARLTVSLTGTQDSIWKIENNFNWNAVNSSLVFPKTTRTSAVVEVSEWGEYEIYYRLQTIDGCEKTDTFEMSFYPRTTTDFDFITEAREGCQPFYAEVVATPQNSELNYFWITDAEPYPAGNQNQFIYDEPGQYDVGLIAQSAETGCADTLIKTNWITVHVKPKAAFEVDYPVALTENARISFTNLSENADYFSWNFGDGAGSDQLNPVHTYSAPGEYNSQLIAETQFGCTDTAAQKITILQSPNQFPNAFRPNSPIEENRTFMPLKTGVDETRFHLKIYNRWGELVFETNSPDNPWKGEKQNGQSVPAGNYVWIANYFDIQGIEHQKKGQVLLIR